MKSLNCTPISVPAISDTSSHPLWQSWDLAVEKCLLAIIAMKKSGVPVAGNPDISLNIPNPMSSSVMPSPVGLHRAQTTGAPQMNPSASSGATSGSLSTSFFTENLNAFELWLDFGGQSGLNDKTPIYLPILLQVLLSQSHRQKALHLLSRYLSLGPEAANNALLVGVFPYILKLLNNPSSETQQILMAIWTYVLGFDNRCRQELVKDNFVHIFIHNLKIDSTSHKQKTMAAFILCEICHNYRPGQKACLDLKMHVICSSLLGAPFTQPHAHLKKWLLFAIAKLCEDFNLAKFQCIAENIHMRLYQYRYDSHPAVRIAAVVALGELFGASLVFNSVPTTPTTPGNKNGSNSPNSRLAEQCKIRNIELEIAMNILEGCMDGCVAVRIEAVIALSKVFVCLYSMLHL
jgi:regulator-associated protein of mTOR